MLQSNLAVLNQQRIPTGATDLPRDARDTSLRAPQRAY
jgi:hypothetical protein